MEGTFNQQPWSFWIITVDLLKLDTYLIVNYSANMHLKKGFVGLRRVFVELFKKNEVSHLSKSTFNQQPWSFWIITVHLLKLDTYLIANYSANMHLKKVSLAYEEYLSRCPI